jgi:hypothetical protein
LIHLSFSVEDEGNYELHSSLDESDNAPREDRLRDEWVIAASHVMVNNFYLSPITVTAWFRSIYNPRRD